MASPHSRFLIIGVGNEYRCDDGAGLIVARRLKQQTRDDVTVLEQSGEGGIDGSVERRRYRGSD